MNLFNINGQLVSENDACISHKNRKFRYSDGFFETIVIEEKKIIFWSYHLDRIQRACEILSYDQPSDQFLKSAILELLDACGEDSSIVNIHFWRTDGGLYTPENSSLEFLISIRPQKQKNESNKPINTGISSTVFNNCQPWSFFKSESLKYVLAGQEMRKNGWDDILILDQSGNLSECLSSNLFWKKDGVLYTPDLSTGCIDGVRRRVLIDETKKNRLPLEVGLFHSDVLKEAEYVFRTNVNGIFNLNLV